MMAMLQARDENGLWNESAFERASALLRSGGLVAFPTETVYGLGANALDEVAVARIFTAKGRPSFNPLIVHVVDVDAARRCAAHWPEVAERLAAIFWPGPLTLVVPRARSIPGVVTGGLEAVALRIPAHPVARELLMRAATPVAAPSANPFMAVSPTTAAHVAQGLAHRIDLILDGGPCEVGIESTVLDVTSSPPRLLRPGAITTAQIEAVVGRIETIDERRDEGPRLSPGLLTKHYAPRGVTTLLPSICWPDWMGVLPSDARIGGISIDADAPEDRRIVKWVRLGSDPTEYARGLYSALHELDASDCTHVLLESPPEIEPWWAIRDRLTRAAGYDETGRAK
jgi:L-threonylcarbamoyladenylate synthase